MARRDIILRDLNLATSVGAEIGPLDRPLVARSDSRVIYVDHLPTNELRAKYASVDTVDDSLIPEVDAVWGDNTLAEAVGRTDLDYVVASHVVEHVPDLLGWLNEVHAVLRPEGQLRLAVPDRRFTFDFLREDSRLSDVLNAYILKARRPLPHAILDCGLDIALVDSQAVWHDAVDFSAISTLFGFDVVLALAKDAAENAGYHDMHCWTVTPYSLADLCVRLGERGLLRFRCAWFEDTLPGDMEFFVSLVPSTSTEAIVLSWQRMKDSARQDAPNSRFRPRDVLAPTAARLEHAAAKQAERQSELQEQRDLAHERLMVIKHLEAELAAKDLLAHQRLQLVHETQAQCDVFRRSTSWRLTAPVRALAQLLR